MKALLALFLVLSASQSFGSPAKVLSQVCGHRYVEGIKKERPNGQIVRECSNKNFLPEVYETDINSRCSITHSEGMWFFSSNGFHYKNCIRTSKLEETYPTHNKCARGYSSDKVSSYIEYDYPYIVCVRDLR